jgi:DNA-binding transcriptional regulator YiaG
MTAKDYHYTECGLDFVYLADGFEVADSPRGRHVAIKDIDGLHRLIGKLLVDHRKTLSGKEIRFLRHEMLMSQATLARLLGVSEQAIHRWERGKTERVPEPADALIRLLYREHIQESRKVRASLAKIAEIEDETDDVLTLRRTSKRQWSMAA